MRAYLVAPVFLIFSMLFPVSARASGIVDLQFVGEGHTITFSLPDSGIVMDHRHAVWMFESAPATIDGVSGFTVDGMYYTRRFIGQFPSIILLMPPPGYNPFAYLWGRDSVLSETVIPINNPTQQYPDDLLLTFVPGTYQLQRSSSGWYNDRIAPYTLTITQESSAVPEPASLVLLATGMVGVGGAIRSRMRG